MIPFNIIVAVDSRRGIGKNGQLPWRLPGELKHFKEVTTFTNDPAKKNVVIMGRKTWVSLPDKFRPLPGRINVVLTRKDQSVFPAAVFKYSSLDEALRNIKTNQGRESVEDVFVIGGGEVFKEALEHPCCQRIFLTIIENDFLCDVFLPEFPEIFQKNAESQIFHENEVSYRFCEYVRKLS